MYYVLDISRYLSLFSLNYILVYSHEYDVLNLRYLREQYDRYSPKVRPYR